MTGHLLGLLAAFILHTISALGYFGILLLMAVESACIPLPSEITLPFAGYLAWAGRFDLAIVAVVGALGCNLGSEIAYEIGAHGGRTWAERYARWLLLRRDDFARADRWFARHGDATVFLCRLLPVFRTFIALPAGIARMRRGRFHVYTFLGSLPWCWALAYFGYRLGEHWARLQGALHRFDDVILAVLAAGFAWFVWHHWPSRRDRRLLVAGSNQETIGNEK